MVIVLEEPSLRGSNYETTTRGIFFLRPIRREFFECGRHLNPYVPSSRAFVNKQVL